MSSITTDRERLTAFASVIKELNHLSSARQVQLWQTALVASVGFLGILLSLPPVSTPLPLHTRLVFLSALVSLSLGCLSIAIVLYDHSMLFERVKRQYTEESTSALRERRPHNVVAVYFPRRTKAFSISIASAAFPSLALFLLLAYSFLVLI